VYQINVQLPADLGSSYRQEPLIVRIGGRESNPAGIFVAGTLQGSARVARKTIAAFFRQATPCCGKSEAHTGSAGVRNLP
jgi:hypothetical protein